MAENKNSRTHKPKNIPSEVKINHIVYSIEELKQKKVRVDGDDCFGTCNYTERIIKISKDNPNTHKEYVLLHEIIHAIDYAAGHTLQESEVHALAIGIFGVMKDNKEIREYIFG